MNDIKDVKPPVNLFDWRLLAIVLLCLIITAVGVYLFLRRKKRSLVVPKTPVVQLPAWEIAYQQLDALRAENLLDKELFKEFFIRVSDIARHYMENRFQIHAPHMTTEEFLTDLGRRGHLNETQKIALRDFLNSCDMVKFAKHTPTTIEALKNFDLAKRLVDDTRV